MAEQLEHIQSDELINKLDAFLGHPSHDPHGDPIPDRMGNIQRDQKIILAQVNAEVICTCVGVKDSSSDFLKYLSKNAIALGTEIEVISKEPFDDSMIVKIGGSERTISKEVTQNIYVKFN